MEPKQIIQDISKTINQLKEAEAEYQIKTAILNKELEVKKANILSQLGLNAGELVTLEILEHRDDRVHCFAGYQTAECFLHGVEMKTADGNPFLCPVLKKKNKKREIYWNAYLSWNLLQNGKIILSHHADQVIIPGTYTEKQLEKIRERVSISQKI